MMSTERKKILVLTDWFAPGFKAGGPIRSLVNLTDALPEMDFYVVTSDRDHRSTRPYDGITPCSWVRHRPHVQVYYARGGRLTSATWRSLFAAHAYDYFYFNSLFSPRFTLQPLIILRRLGLAHKAVIAPRGMLQPGALSVKPLRKKIFLTLSKHLGFFRSLRWHATSADEVASVLRYLPEAGVVLAPNLTAAAGSAVSHPPKLPGVLHLVTIARYSPEKGITESIAYLKTLDGAGEVRLDIYGTRQGDDYYNACLSLAQSLRTVSVKLHGEVAPEQIPALLSHAHFYYSATRGENYGHAIAEALVAGVPVVVSNLTPWKDLPARYAGFDCQASPEGFAPVLQQCLDMDQDTYTQWTAGARAMGEGIARSSQDTEAYRLLFT